MKRLLKLGLALGLAMAFAFMGCKHETVEPEPEPVYSIDNSLRGYDVWIEVSPRRAKAGETVTVTVVKTEDGIDTVRYVAVVDADRNIVAYFPGDTGGTFVMPASNVRIETKIMYRNWTPESE